MPGRVRVIPEDLHMSAATVDAHADDVQVRHATANGRIESAQKGLPATTAAALSTAVTKWHADTAALFGRMVDHSVGLRAGWQRATSRWTMAPPQRSTRRAPRINPEDMGL